ncbi:MAG: hypothetical protein H6773_00045 [Pseudomonadales bacterium]|nr:hypothetical protein [Pseudomonadales bacterium]
MKTVRRIFNDDFYKITAVLLSKKFSTLETTLKSKFDKAGLIIPEKGFTNESQYREWLKMAMNLPKKPGKFIEDILLTFNLDVNNEFFRNCVTSRLFFNKMPWQESVYPQTNITLTTRNSGKDRGLWVEIKPWTKKQDYIELWETIKMLQKSLIGYRSKEKFQKTFARDFDVYQLYFETKQSIESELVSFDKVMNKIADNPKYHLLAKKFKDGNIDEQVRQINSRFDELLKDVNIF